MNSALIFLLYKNGQIQTSNDMNSKVSKLIFATTTIV